MSGIFPNAPDGGVAPNIPQPNGYTPTVGPFNTGALYYSDGCDVRLRAEVLNALISEIAAIADNGGSGYNAAARTNLLLATQRIVQRRDMNISSMSSNDAVWYNAGFNPPPLAYYDLMDGIFVPTVANSGAAYLNLNGMGPLQILRYDGQPLRSGDLTAYAPIPLVKYGSYWWCLRAVPSQFPQSIWDGRIFWVRNDGNDATGDGSENIPQKAFQTLEGAYVSLYTKFYPNGRMPTIRIGLAGTYTGLSHNRWPGPLNVDSINPGSMNSFVIVGEPNGMPWTMNCGRNCELNVNGLQLNATNQANAVAARCFNGYMTIQNCDVRGAGSGSMCFGCEASGLMFLLDNNRMRNNANYGMRISAGAHLWIQGALTIQNSPNYGTCFAGVESGGHLDNHGGGDTVGGAATGKRYSVTSNGIIMARGVGVNWLPGNVAGTEDGYGHYFP